MKTIFYYKPRYVKEGVEGEVSGGVEAVRLANLEQAAWEYIADYEGRENPLWDTVTDLLGPDMIVFSWTQIDLHTAAVEDLITKTQYVLPSTHAPAEIAKLGPLWMQSFVKRRGYWNHTLGRYERKATRT